MQSEADENVGTTQAAAGGRTEPKQNCGQQQNKMINTDETLKVEELEMKWLWERS